MKLAAAARALEEAIGRVCAAAAVGFGLAIFVLMLLGIVSRHVLTTGVAAITELPEQLFAWFVMVSIVLAARAGEHVAVEFLAVRLGRVWRRWLGFLARWLTVALCGTVVWSVARVAAISGGDRSPILGIPTLHFHIALATGFALIGVLAICAIARDAGQRRS